DPASIGSSQPGHLLVRANSDDAVAADGDGLRNREFLVDGDDFAVGKDDVGDRLLGEAWGGAEEKDEKTRNPEVHEASLRPTPNFQLHNSREPRAWALGIWELEVTSIKSDAQRAR